MKFTHKETSLEVIVTVQLPALHRDRKTGLDTNRTVLRRRDIRNYLNKLNITVGECTQSCETDNMGGGTLTAVWKFKKPQPKKLDTTPKPVVSSNKAKRTKKVTEAKDE